MWLGARAVQIEPDTPLTAFTVPINALEDAAGALRDLGAHVAP